MRCVVTVSAAFLLITALEVRQAHANPAVVAAKAAQAASRAAQLSRAAGAAGKAGRMTKLGRIGSRAMRRAMTGRNFGGSGMRPNVLRLRMRKAMKTRSLRSTQRFAAERNKGFRAFMKKRMGQVRQSGPSFVQKQLAKRPMSMKRLRTDRKLAVRKMMHRLNRRSRVESNQRDAERRRQMRSHAAQQRRASAPRGVLSTALSRSVAR